MTRASGVVGSDPLLRASVVQNSSAGSPQRRGNKLKRRKATYYARQRADISVRNGIMGRLMALSEAQSSTLNGLAQLSFAIAFQHMVSLGSAHVGLHL